MGKQSIFSSDQKYFVYRVFVSIQEDLKEHVNEEIWPPSIKQMPTELTDYLKHGRNTEYCAKLTNTALYTTQRNDCIAQRNEGEQIEGLSTSQQEALALAANRYSNFFNLARHKLTELPDLIEHYDKMGTKGVDAFIQLLENKDRAKIKMKKLIDEHLPDEQKKRLTFALNMNLPFESNDERQEVLGKNLTDALMHAHKAVIEFVCNKDALQSTEGLESEKALRAYVKSLLNQVLENGGAEHVEVKSYVAKLRDVFERAKMPGEINQVLAFFQTGDGLEKAIRLGTLDEAFGCSGQMRQ